MEDIKIQLEPGAILPTRGTLASAGYDLCAKLDCTVTIIQNSTLMIPTGLRFEFPESIYGEVFIRSSLALQGVQLANGVGIIDTDYRGEVKLLLYNSNPTVVFINPNQKLAQIIFKKLIDVRLTTVSSLECTERGEGGFGSTGLFRPRA